MAAGEWDSRNLFRLDGSRSAGARLARDVGWSERSANRFVRRAKRLRQNRLVEDGYVNGDLSTDKIDVLCDAALPARRHLFAEAEASLVGDAKRLSCDDLQSVVDYWAAARERFGPMANATNLPRTATQRRADALIIMASRSGTVPADGRAPSPLFSVLMDDNTARRVCEMADGTVVAPKLLASWITQADFERVIFDTPKRVIELGVRTRFFTGGLRRSIELRDRHCTFPGCTVPAKHCEVDHIIEYSQGGLTTQQNGRLRCPTHNRQRPGRAGQPPQGP